MIDIDPSFSDIDILLIEIEGRLKFIDRSILENGVPFSKIGTSLSEIGTSISKIGTPLSENGTPFSEIDTPFSEIGTSLFEIEARLDFVDPDGRMVEAIWMDPTATAPKE